MPLPPRDFTQIGPNEGEILATLGATPGGIGDLARGLSGAQLAKRPEEGEWCFTEILDHLLAGERDTILPRLRGVRDEDAPVFASPAPAAPFGTIRGRSSFATGFSVRLSCLSHVHVGGDLSYTQTEDRR